MLFGDRWARTLKKKVPSWGSDRLRTLKTKFITFSCEISSEWLIRPANILSRMRRFGGSWDALSSRWHEPLKVCCVNIKKESACGRALTPPHQHGGRKVDFSPFSAWSRTKAMKEGPFSPLFGKHNTLPAFGENRWYKKTTQKKHVLVTPFRSNQKESNSSCSRYNLDLCVKWISAVFEYPYQCSGSEDERLRAVRGRRRWKWANNGSVQPSPPQPTHEIRPANQRDWHTKECEFSHSSSFRSTKDRHLSFGTICGPSDRDTPRGHFTQRPHERPTEIQTQIHRRIKAWFYNP